MGVSMLNLLKDNKCFCYKRQKEIALSECEINTCKREKKCTKTTNGLVTKEINNARKNK